ncbi:aminotransferase class I/II-fold pyridoxal phosphate-dependent enzyme [Lentibacillus cibarius]|uniref:Aminotransferase class I/II-fold pyridoxal phosphate-dependent enzyme n=1 Tax=Lentibacillus cibarius TaxID=2583219 RepID=A0A549YGS5_9BACI|nr:aminotransferase class I/II-fold pyridoxal phosphate-dependent enzyme [Lentibacillus cibarius]TRM11091.1 aminotransferase class I/II-fold pyridoxal phosphate-dependent enzyme [Lentibacillus cibarius]
MKVNQTKIPLYELLKRMARSNPISFHVPGHKNGNIFPKQARPFFESILPFDMTELTGLDDLHAPQGVIAEAQDLAASFFGADDTYFLVGGSTAGNLSMIMSVCSPGDQIIVQRNSHKSIMNGLELSGARPVFVAPEFDDAKGRYTAPSIPTVQEALRQHSKAKAVVLTYPDYFGGTFALKEMIELAHAYHIPVLVDEAHGVHFSLKGGLPASALELGADVVVQSAHKMAPAMTMGSYLHVRSSLVTASSIAHYLQMLQSSSPSYPIMASLDLARHYLANLTARDLELIIESATHVRDILANSELWDVLSADDPVKITLQAKRGMRGDMLAQALEKEGVIPELTTHSQVLLIHGLAPFTEADYVKNAVKRIEAQLKLTANHDIIDADKLFTENITTLELDYQTMQQCLRTQVPLRQSAGYIAAEAITPYPPGIPMILKGERITEKHLELVRQLLKRGISIQHRDISRGISVFQ